MPLAAQEFETPAACTHCTLPVPAGLIEPGAEEQFCCAACRTVYAAIQGCGLEAYYRIRDEQGAPQQARVSGRNFLPFDEPAFQERHVRSLPEGRLRVRLYLEGVHCGACVWLVERLPGLLLGLESCRLDLRRQVADLVWNPEQIQLSQIASSLDRLGYPAHPWSEDRKEALRRKEERAHLIRIGIAGACAGNAMLIAFALYGGALSGMEPVYESFFRWTSFGISIIALLGPGRVFLRGALSSLRTRRAHMDLPVAIALVTGTAWGGFNTWRGTGSVYFESITAVIFLLLIGRWIQHRQQRAAQDAVSLLFTLTPSTAIRLESAGPDGEIEKEVSVESLRVGDRVLVRAGDEIAVDGTVLRGNSELDLSLLTGESAPQTIGPGGDVHAGTQNLSQPIVIEARSTGEQTRVGQLMQQVERFAQDRAPLVRLSDRVAHGFVLTVIAVAVVTAIAWWPTSPDAAIGHAIALLVVTCPCALGLATPLAILAAIGRAAERGILIKGGESLERLARPGRIWIDKTGTLTRGELELADWYGDDSVRPWILALERGVRHPVADAFVRALGGADDDAPSVTPNSARSVRQVGGCGIRGEIDGHEITVGKPDWVAASASVMSWVTERTAEIDARAHSPIWITVDGAVVAVAGFGDLVRPEAAGILRRLKQLGWTVSILSGDRSEVVNSVSGELGLAPASSRANATPEDKVAEVRGTSAERVARPVSGRDGALVMVGDGVNDAAALSAADVGIAVSGGAPASLAAADIYTQREGLEPLLELIQGSRRTVRVIRRNILFSLGYNLLAGGLAVAGLIDPMIAAILMPFSSLTVVASSYRSATFQAEGASAAGDPE